MSLTINGKTYNPNEIKEATIAFKALPGRKVIPFDDSIHIKPQEAVVTKEREIAYATPDIAKYIGTEGLADCILLYLQDGDNHAVIHVSSALAPLGIDELLSHFSSRDNVKVSLMGGVNSDRTADKLKHIIDSLIKAKTPITAVTQNIIDNNKFNVSSQPLFTRDKLLAKSRVIFEMLYGKEFDMDRFASLKTSIFMEPFKAKNKKDADAILVYIRLFCLINELVPDTNFMSVIEELQSLRKSYPNETQFYDFLPKVFYADAYHFLIKEFERNDLFDAGDLRNFVINMETGDIHKISVHLPRPYDAQRAVYLFDSDGEERNGRYFMCFDGANYIKPILSQEITNLVHKVNESFDTRRVPMAMYQSLTQKYGFSFFRALKTIKKEGGLTQNTGSTASTYRPFVSTETRSTPITGIRQRGLPQTFV